MIRTTATQLLGIDDLRRRDLISHRLDWSAGSHHGSPPDARMSASATTIRRNRHDHLSLATRSQNHHH